MALLRYGFVLRDVQHLLFVHEQAQVIFAKIIRAAVGGRRDNDREALEDPDDVAQALKESSSFANSPACSILASMFVSAYFKVQFQAYAVASTW